MSFTVEKSGSVTVVRVAENITFVNQREFDSIWERLLVDEVRAAVLDLGTISYFGSMAFGLLAKTFNRLKEKGCRLVIVRPEKDEVFQVFKITRLVDLIEFFPSEREAFEALGVDSSDVTTVVLEDADPVGSKIEKLKDPDPEVRRYTAWALGLLGDSRAVPALEEALARDHELRVREAAAESLEKLTGQRQSIPREPLQD